ncbi:hypothetical protein HDV05_004441 [Chytridiales sp. JEL 0842]|nr:hypothetical protein HDV05_004441 [Chytridiales sp. JEL 0842]
MMDLNQVATPTAPILLSSHDADAPPAYDIGASVETLNDEKQRPQVETLMESAGGKVKITKRRPTLESRNRSELPFNLFAAATTVNPSLLSPSPSPFLSIECAAPTVQPYNPAFQTAVGGGSVSTSQGNTASTTRSRQTSAQSGYDPQDLQEDPIHSPVLSLRSPVCPSTPKTPKSLRFLGKLLGGGSPNLFRKRQGSSKAENQNKEAEENNNDVVVPEMRQVRSRQASARPPSTRSRMGSAKPPSTHSHNACDDEDVSAPDEESTAEFVTPQAIYPSLTLDMSELEMSLPPSTSNNGLGLPMNDILAFSRKWTADNPLYPPPTVCEYREEWEPGLVDVSGASYVKPSSKSSKPLSAAGARKLLFNPSKGTTLCAAALTTSSEWKAGILYLDLNSSGGYQLVCFEPPKMPTGQAHILARWNVKQGMVEAGKVNARGKNLVMRLGLVSGKAVLLSYEDAQEMERWRLGLKDFIGKLAAHQRKR